MLEKYTDDYILNIIENQHYKTRTMLSSLLTVQDDIGFLPKNSINVVADFMNVSTNDVWGVASFYLNFRFDPPGKYNVEICWGPTCHIGGASELQHTALEKLNLVNQGDTEDGKVSLKFNTCLGACPQAPLISVNHKLHGKMDVKKFTKILDELN